MKTSKFTIRSENETNQFGERLAGILRAGDVVGLSGDLGAGKTFLSNAISRGLGVPKEEPVNSPTFTLINEYTGGRVRIYHMDLYRLGDSSELYDLGLWDYYGGDGVCLVEWFDKFEDLWPKDALVLTLHLGENESRTIAAAGEGRGAELISALDGLWEVA